MSKGNETLYANNTSGYQGVSWDKSCKRWKAIITVEGKLKNLGKFKCKHEAARAYNSAARHYHGEGCFLNVIAEES